MGDPMREGTLNSSNSKKKLHWVIFGCGAVGGYFGARLIQSGEARVTFLVRGETLAALRTNGLQIHSISGNVTIPPEQLLLADTNTLPESMNAEDQADVFMLACKTWQAEAALKQCVAYLHADTAVLPLQNGVEGLEGLQQVCAELKGHVLGGYCNIVAAIKSPGVISHFAAHPPYIHFGELDNEKTPIVLAMQDAFSRCPGMKGTVADDILASQWEKFVFISTTASVNAIAHATQDQIASTPSLLQLWTDAAKEVIAIARAKGVGYKDEWLTKRIQMLAQAVGGTASMARDIWAGRRSEIDELGGSVVAMGKALGIPTPVHESMLRVLLFRELQARGEIERPAHINVLSEGRTIFGMICAYKGQTLPRMPAPAGAPPQIHFYVAPTSAYLDGQVDANARTVVPPDAKMMFEVELGVVINQPCSQVSAIDAMKYVGGYVVALDMTAQNFGFADMELGVSWTRSKCYDTFKPISAFIPKEDIPNPDDVSLYLTVNGTPKGKGFTRDLKVSIPKLIEHISSICRLQRGDVILTGAPFMGDCGVGDVIVGGIDGLAGDFRVKTTLVSER